MNPPPQKKNTRLLGLDNEAHWARWASPGVGAVAY